MFLPTFMTSEHPGSHVFQQTRTIFIHIQDIIKTNILTKKNAPPLGGQVFQGTGTIFKLVQDIIETNLLTRFHDWKINVASRVLTRNKSTALRGVSIVVCQKKMFTNCLQTDRQTDRQTDGRTDGRRTVSDHKSSPRAIAQVS
ncbi:hypothetical protein DPMN_079957 [Dreissena polymorpha]|uniref:Uncharacterized protein n=1 Tax=Dreissena polymorpha TaxID=45954 RepID=A0A9D4BRK3_DREPO|nr:hypothetical protein DPMN_079957 [Dreissena polymorpha]